MQSVSPPRSHPAVISHPVLQLVRLELPLELDDALRMSALDDAFAKLSKLQQESYAEWVGDGLEASSRWERAGMVCRVIRPVY